MITDDPAALELHPREYVCDRCRLVHWSGVEGACDR